MAMSKEERLAERKRVDAFMASKQKQMASAKKPAAPVKKPVSQPAKQSAASKNAEALRKKVTDKYAPSGFHRLIKALGG